MATSRYATNLAAAKASGYQIITRMIPSMGWHFLNPKVKAFNIRRPAILVYEHCGRWWQLGALEWVFTAMPSKPPLPGARYGVFRSMSLRGRHVRVRVIAGAVPEAGPAERRRVRLLASPVDHAALLGLVLELQRDLLGLEPDGRSVQQRVKA
jgi:hypothetical protein